MLKRWVARTCNVRATPWRGGLGLGGIAGIRNRISAIKYLVFCGANTVAYSGKHDYPRSGRLSSKKEVELLDSIYEIVHEPFGQNFWVHKPRGHGWRHA
jgi:hypothetical protein